MNVPTPSRAASHAPTREPLSVRLAERGWIPDALLRFGIRRLCRARIAAERAGGAAATAARQEGYLQALRAGPIAIETDAANAQHYELPPAFFTHCLGPHLKYSACYWDEHTPDLGAAERAMLELYCERAELAEGQRVLELGCGWGSLSLFMAERYPQSHFTVVSNSNAQREFIQARRRERSIGNLHVITADVNALSLESRHFDRIVSVEMFEHVRNHTQLFERLSDWLRPDGKLFVHIFCHRDLLYPFETEANDDWMGRHFFSGGVMPAADTFMKVQDVLKVEQFWLLPGTHYARTANAWLANQDRQRTVIFPILAEVYGSEHAELWWQRWRMFWMACAELFGYDQGHEWLVAHYRFTQQSRGNT